MGGYELNIAMDILRGLLLRKFFLAEGHRAPNVPLTYKFILPIADHVFLPAHRIMAK